MMKEDSTSTTDDTEHVFRFKLNTSDIEKSGVDPLVETVRSFVADFLDLGCFTHKGKRVQVDGFFFTNDIQRQYSIFDNRFEKKK